MNSNYTRFGALQVCAIVLSLMISATCSLAQPKLMVLPAASHDWGDVAAGVLEATLILKNTGDSTLKISDVLASCGCTTAPLWKKEIPAGDTAMINIHMDVKTKEGVQTKELTILSNNPEASTVTIPLKANIIRDVKAMPGGFPSILNVKVGEETQSAVDIVNLGTDTIRLEVPVFSSNSMTATLNLTKPVLLYPGHAANLIATFRLQKSGMATGKVLLKTSSQYVPTLEVDMMMIGVAEGQQAQISPIIKN